MSALERFTAHVSAPDPRLDLSLALVASAGRPEVDPDQLVARLDELAAGLDAHDAAGLCEDLFAPGGPVGLCGDRVTYHSPDNSLLDRVLDRRLGIPITLGAIAIEVGRRRGIEVVGIGMPGHFLVGDRTTGRFHDPFDAGRAFGVEGARGLFHRLHGPATAFEPAYLAPVGTVAIVRRVLVNLQRAHRRAGDRDGEITALTLRSRLPGDAVAAGRELAEALAAAGRFDEAARLHDSLASEDPGGRERHERAALRLRARLN